MEQAATFSVMARRLGILSALGVTLLCALYAIALVAGLLSLPTPQETIGDPFFSVLEILILVLAPLMVMLAAATYFYASERSKVFGLLSLVFMSLLAVLTCSVHFIILTVSRNTAVAAFDSTLLFLAFKWPSIVYALDILAWDVFFGLSAVFAACVFEGSRLTSWVRVLLMVSGALAFAGLSGVFSGNMQLRNIGIIGYVVVYPVATALIAILFMRTKPRATV